MRARDLRRDPLEVLIVEDDARFSDALSLFLAHDDRIRFLVVARDLATAVAEAQAREFDIALVDVRLGRNEEGFAVVEALREVRPSCVAVMMSGLDASDVRQQALAAGASGILQKTDLARDGREAVVNAYLRAHE